MLSVQRWGLPCRSFRRALFGLHIIRVRHARQRLSYSAAAEAAWAHLDGLGLGLRLLLSLLGMLSVRCGWPFRSFRRPPVSLHAIRVMHAWHRPLAAAQQLRQRAHLAGLPWGLRLLLSLLGTLRRSCSVALLEGHSCRHLLTNAC